jgi:type IV secretory pathway VirB10-like protein
MSTTDKIVQQVQCLACGKSMSATNLKYSHAQYCTERNQEPKPEEIPAPEIEVKNGQTLTGRKSLPVKRTKATQQQQAHEEAYTPPPPPSRQKPEKRETPEEYWNTTVKNMKEKKLAEYKFLCSNAF